MKVHSNKRKAESSPTCSSPSMSNSLPGHPAASFTRRIKSKRTVDEKPSYVLLADIDKLTKKKVKQKASRNSYNSEWHISPIKNASSDESDSLPDLDRSLNSLHNISEIFANNISEHSDVEDQEESDEMVEETSDMESNHSDSQFYRNLKKKIVPQIRPPLKKRKMTGDPSSSVISVKLRNSILLLMNHPAATSLNDYVSIEVLSGTVSVCGYERKAGDALLRVFSSKATGLIEVKTESYDELWMRKESLKKLGNKLHEVTGSKETAREILMILGKTTVLVVIKHCALPPSLQFTELYYPEVFDFKFTKNYLGKVYGEGHVGRKVTPFFRKKKIFYLPTNESTVQFNPDVEDLVIDVMTAIRNSNVYSSEGPRILVFGPKNSGKSTLMRYLMNKALTTFPAVYYLDADPGQTEFTPPGVISLTEVIKPVIGPSFCHQRKPILMTFIGGISAEMSPDMYCKSVSKSVRLFMEHFTSDTLFINTMGWIKGLGLECLKNIMKDINPTIVIEMVSEHEDSMFDYKPYISNKAKYFEIRSIFPETKGKTDKNPAQKQRELTVLSYFGKCQSLYERPTYLNSFKPFCICWDEIPVYIFGKKIVPYRLVESLNASIVALCTVEESQIMESTIPELPLTLEDEPDNECLGFGIVRAIDEIKHLLYIVTPLSLLELKFVNAIMKGNVTVPNSVFLEQPIVGVPLPFTDEREIKKPESEVESLDESDEGEACVQSSKIPDKYRESVKDRRRKGKRKPN